MKYRILITLLLNVLLLKSQDMPVMTFETKTHQFGKVKIGEKPIFTYIFTNTGNKPLNILMVSGCDCSDLDWSRETIEPKGKGFLKLTFNTLRLEKEEYARPLKKYIDIVLKEQYPNKDYPIAESLTFEIEIIND
jgi:Protein of unknown function (DUF1573)